MISLKIKRVVARILKFVKRLKGFKSEKYITVEDLKLAEILIIGHVQSSTFEREIKALRLGQKIPKSSTVRNLTHFLNKDGILCVRGRLENVDFDFNKHLYLLSHERPLVEKSVCLL